MVVGTTAIARDGDNVQQAHESLATTQGFEYVLDKDEMARKAAQKAVELLAAKPVKGRAIPRGGWTRCWREYSSTKLSAIFPKRTSSMKTQRRVK